MVSERGFELIGVDVEIHEVISVITQEIVEDSQVAPLVNAEVLLVLSVALEITEELLWIFEGVLVK